MTVQRKRALSINIIQGNIIHLEVPAIALGLFEGVTLTAATLEFDRILKGEIKEYNLRRELDSRLGRLSIPKITSEKLKTNQLIFSGLGKFNDFDTPALMDVAKNLAAGFIERKISTITTVPIGLGTGYKAGDIMRTLFSGFIDTINYNDPESIINTINICDFNERNCADLLSHCNSLNNEGLFQNFEVSINSNKVSSARADGEEHPPSIHLILEVKPSHENPDSHIILEQTFMGATNSAISARYKKELSVAELKEKVNQLIKTNYIEHNHGLETLKHFIHQDIIDRIEYEIEKKDCPIKILHDNHASAIPWEAISLSNKRFPSTNIPISRSFLTEMSSPKKWSDQREKADHFNVLIIADPTSDLPGAIREGNAIFNILDKMAYVYPTKLFQEKATKENILKAFNSGQYDAVHYAGHANFDEKNQHKTGLFCADRQFLSGLDIRELKAFPSLMFMNACESAMIKEADLKISKEQLSKEQFMQNETGIAEAFLTNGAMQFLGTYWPVGDNAAEVFARQFYLLLIDGCTIGEAIFRARQEVWKSDNRDWANYIHFGDPSLRLKN